MVGVDLSVLYFKVKLIKIINDENEIGVVIIKKCGFIDDENGEMEDIKLFLS